MNMPCLATCNVCALCSLADIPGEMHFAQYIYPAQNVHACLCAPDISESFYSNTIYNSPKLETSHPSVHQLEEWVNE